MSTFDQDPAYSQRVAGLMGDISIVILRAHGLKEAKEYASEFLRLYSQAQSPIEALVATHLAAHASGGEVGVQPQAQIGEYRVDFLITCSGSKRAGIVIECDGHNYHERTKEQAARDRRRDRWMQGQGFLVLRFTGSEIVSGDSTVAREINQAIDGLLSEAESN